MRHPTAAFVVVLALLAHRSPSRAQPFDHLKCHRLKDGLHALTYTADLDALQKEFSDTKCKISAKAVLFCVPVNKHDVSPVPPRQDGGPSLDVDYTCYRAKCPLSPPDKDVADQFGYRHQTKYVTSMLCAPSRKGCQTRAPHACGGACPNPNEVCTILPNDVCSCQTTTTTTSTTTTTVPCQLDAAGACSGDCPQGEICVGGNGTPCSCQPQCSGLVPPACGAGGCPAPKICEKDFTTSFCYCCSLGGAPCATNGDCCTQQCQSGTCL